MTAPLLDAYGDVVNAPATYAAIAAKLKAAARVFVGWTDGAGTHYDILFTMAPNHFGRSNCGLAGPLCLFMSVMGNGAFGFAMTPEPRAAVYVAEKLFNQPHADETCEALADLLNGINAAWPE